MGVIRVNKTKNYTVLSNYHFKEKNMSLKAKGLLSLMLSLPDDWNYNVSGLVKLSKDGKDSVMSALGELEKFGYLSRSKVINEKGQFSGVEYNIYEQPQLEYPSAENANAAIPTSGKSPAEKPPLSNTNKSNTNNNKIIYNINNYIHLLDKIVDNELRNLFCDFLDNRNHMGHPLTVKGFEILVDRVRDIAGIDVEKQKQLLKVAIINNWKNVYAKDEAPSSVLKELEDFYS